MSSFSENYIAKFVIAQQSLYNILNTLRSQIASVAQNVYDKWDEFNIDTYANGGICHLISDKIYAFLDSQGIEAYTHSLDFKQHVVTIAIDHNEKKCYMIDIPEDIYEVGGGFQWKKIKGVVFESTDVQIIPLNYNEWSNSEY